MPNMQQQNPDGSWSDAVPLGWQGSGIDWEVYNPDSERGAGRYLAEGFDEDVHVASIRARTRIGLALRIKRWHKKTGTRPNRG